MAGYSGKVTEEIEKLRRMAQRGDRQRLGTLMKDISQIVAEEVVEEQPGLKPRVRPAYMQAPSHGKICTLCRHGEQQSPCLERCLQSPQCYPSTCESSR